ncbi:haloacid dehalogenase-like hydrolase [Chondromyces crocatus]|uniref:phosphoserine phosphatase n=1 Tax=Chondromyces crocatus TaxID=52 RepID=A0A0K1ENW7_CHOCO|nr:haloacid dehalogenase-like hydrolase [Chondromyces crocatus]AKT42551.1 uncharacterized protein CMC5_067780 [Chondromyces crocatus]
MQRLPSRRSSLWPSPLSTLTPLLALVAFVSGCASGSGSSGAAMGPDGKPLPSLDPNLDWYGDNRQHLDAFLAEHGRGGAAHDPAHPPVAVFDWDNTVIKNDVGDATMFWMLRHDRILQPPGKNWALTSGFLTEAATTALDTACGALAEAGKPLPTSTSTACADAILSVYTGSKTPGGAPAFSEYNHRWIEPAYAWLTQLQAGYRPAEIAAFATAAIDEALAADLDATQQVGSRADLTAALRIYDPIRDLIHVLQQRDIAVWVVSASPQPVVEVFAERVGIPAERVIGVRLVPDAEGRLTANLQGCGPIPDGSNDGQGSFTGNSLITYIEGKRCWINKVIYGDTGPTALGKNADPKKRPAFGAGDADTDITFLQDATASKLVVNRNKPEIMCNAYRNLGGRWLVNPMFLAPKPRDEAGYPCSTTACKDLKGAPVACLDEAGQPIPDQTDDVF